MGRFDWHAVMLSVGGGGGGKPLECVLQGISQKRPTPEFLALAKNSRNSQTRHGYGFYIGVHCFEMI